MEALLPILGAIVQFGGVAVAFGLVVVGILRVGKYVDLERDRIVASYDKRIADLIKERDEREAKLISEWTAREARLIAERDAREARLVAEVGAWQGRAEAWDSRLDRVAAAFERLANAPAPD